MRLINPHPILPIITIRRLLAVAPIRTIRMRLPIRTIRLPKLRPRMHETHGLRRQLRDPVIRMRHSIKITHLRLRRAGDGLEKVCRRLVANPRLPERVSHTDLVGNYGLEVGVREIRERAAETVPIEHDGVAGVSGERAGESDLRLVGDAQPGGVEALVGGAVGAGLAAGGVVGGRVVVEVGDGV